MFFRRRFPGLYVCLAVLALLASQGPQTVRGQDPVPDATSSLTSEAAPAPTALSVEERQAYMALSAKRLQDFKGNAELAQYLRLRKAALADRLPNPEEDMGRFGLMGMGQSYKLNAQMNDLSQSDCVTFTEQVVALACTDSWETAYKLQNRLRYKGGQGSKANLNREPIAEWIPNNAWLFNDITETLDAPLVEFDVFDWRTMLAFRQSVSEGKIAGSDEEFPPEKILTSRYIPKDAIVANAGRLRTGDLLFVIGRHAARPVDPVIRPRCIHQAIIHINSEGPGILHSSPPVAGRWTLERLFSNPSILGGRILRLKPDARRIVTEEFTRLGIVLDKTPEWRDQALKRTKGQLIEPTRPADGTEIIDGKEYAVAQIRPGETLWGLFRAGWKNVTSLEVNKGFMQRHPDLKAEGYVGERIYFLPEGTLP